MTMRLLPLALVSLALLVTAGGIALGVSTTSPEGAPSGEASSLAGAISKERPHSLAVRTVGDEAGVLEREVRSSGLFRWVLPRSEVWTGHVGPRAVGEVTVVAGLLPLPEEALGWLAGLPVALGADGDRPGGGVRFAGTTYTSPRMATALRLPGASDRTDSPRWLVAGWEAAAVADLVNQVLSLETGIRVWNADSERRVDYILRENPWLERSGRWRQEAGREKEGGTPNHGGREKEGGTSLSATSATGLSARDKEGGTSSGKAGRKEGGTAHRARREVDPAADRDGFAERQRWLASARPILAGPVRLLVPPGREESPELRRLAADLRDALEVAAERLRLAEADRPDELIVAVEPDFVVQGRFTGAIGEAVLGERGSGADLHLVFDARDRHAYRFAVARWLLWRAAASRSLDLGPWLERGAALWALGESGAGGWYGRPWREWLPVTAAAGVLPEADELLAGEIGGDASEPLWTPVAAALVERLGGAAPIERLTDPGAERVARELLRELAAAPASGPTPGRRPEPPGDFLDGVSFAMLNGLAVGYHAPEAARRLAGLRELGADAVSVMPFAYQGEPAAPGLRFLNRSPASETDVGVLHATRRARELGLRVLWKPHIWVGHGAWSGEIAMRSEADWKLWWRSYRRWIVHQALLARWAGADLFSLGVEMGGTLERQTEWAELIAAVRRVFPGLLTYSANWHGDAEHVPFWPELDLLGVDAYYPLSASADAGPEELLAGAREVHRQLARLAERHRRPILLTEVGFASRRATWTAPHEEGGDLSEQDQATAYEALFTGLGRPPWLAGVFVWKAFSGERGIWERADRRRADFRFLGRPAEAVVRRYFTPREEPPVATR